MDVVLRKRDRDVVMTPAQYESIHPYLRQMLPDGRRFVFMAGAWREVEIATNSTSPNQAADAMLVKKT